MLKSKTAELTVMKNVATRRCEYIVSGYEKIRADNAIYVHRFAT